MKNINGKMEGIVMRDGNISSAKYWIPAIEEETCAGIREIALMTKHFKDRKIFISGEITSGMADDFVSKMLFLSKENEPVDIYINSPGGEVNAGLVMYDIIQACKFPINMYCTGLAASMAAVLLAGGQEGRRFILPHSKVMIHEPLISGGLGGSATTIEKTAQSILETKAITNGILAKHTHKSIKEINKATAYDNYMNADDAIAFGMCDEIKNIF